jgi:hypothetical protein
MNMNIPCKKIVLIEIGEPPAREGTKYYSPAEKKIEKSLHEIAQKMDCNVVRNITLREGCLKEGIMEKGPIKQQVDFAFIKNHVWTAVEIDGRDYHREEDDDVKDLYLIEAGWNVIRIKAGLINRHISEIGETIISFLMSGESGKCLSIPERKSEDFRDEDSEWLNAEKEFEAWLVEGPARIVTRVEEII